MQLPQPYLFTSPPSKALVDQSYMLPNQGPVADTFAGYHTLWAAEVPFIPTYVAEDHGDFDSAASNRISKVMQRQVRFLYDLALSREQLTTFEMRLISRPQSSGLARVGIAFLGKVFAFDEETSRKRALDLWNKFSAVFPREAPFSYPLVPVRKRSQMPTSPQEGYGFLEWYEPIPFDRLVSPKSIVEIRKYEDWPQIGNLGGMLHARSYIPHQFVPALDHSAMARLFETMARQRETCVVAITIRPQRLIAQEISFLQDRARAYERISKGEAEPDNPMIEVLQRKLHSDMFESYARTRAEKGYAVYNSLVHEQQSLFLIRLQVIGAPAAQDDLVDALGSEVMANAGSVYPSRWTRVEASDAAELECARFNLQWLEFVRWGISPNIQNFLPLVRLRQFATVSEVAGAFRLPVAPSSGGLAGPEIRDEPFSLPPTLLIEQRPALALGTIIDRGVPTDAAFSVPLSLLAGRSCIFGETGEPRDAFLRELLGGLQTLGIPWVVIRSNGGLGADLAGRLGASHLAIGAASRGRPLGIDPFFPPPGVSLMLFLDALLRVFTAVYGLDAASSVVVRHALLEAYEHAGWSEQHPGDKINLQDLAERISNAAQQGSVPAGVADAIQTQCVLPLRDLAETVKRLLDSSQPPADPWAEPAVIETGWLGSDMSQAIMRGCLWAWLAYSGTTTLPPTSGRLLRGVVGLEDAHDFFSRPPSGHDSQAHSPLSALVETTARSGIGTLLLDDRPDLIDLQGMSGMGLIALTRHTQRKAVESAASLIGASPRQQGRMHRLSATEVALALPGAAPVLLSLS